MKKVEKERNILKKTNEIGSKIKLKINTVSGSKKGK